MEQKTITREEYAKSINAVIAYIGSNLDKELDLNELAAVSNFSVYHFHHSD